MGKIQTPVTELKILRKSPVFALLKKIEDISKFREYSAREILLPPREGVIGYAPNLQICFFLARRNTMKKLCSLLMMLAMAVFIVGCSEDAGDGTATTPTTTTTTTTPETTTTEPKTTTTTTTAPEGEGEATPEGEGESGSTPE
ncbi:MAG TPA: hypothetical protein VMM56_07185 [Planctomycetaceae bacterium]|nr:hypothetical protein [Planctomycetaceae bacterium]